MTRQIPVTFQHRYENAAHFPPYFYRSALLTLSMHLAQEGSARQSSLNEGWTRIPGLSRVKRRQHLRDKKHYPPAGGKWSERWLAWGMHAFVRTRCSGAEMSVTYRWTHAGRHGNVGMSSDEPLADTFNVVACIVHRATEIEEHLMTK
ncbi:uncharacterized protein LAESUDRAFT_713923 [Laetiporus sulphureus 93-53]|uniref:Uncharacterized protein n=1 Tax=Laetiporus sulphureus 93-53 TaxID=1314785 RepID=A0A165EIL8_9APHY|nr:uncharacterized protein LAESUDRAFT_713923 [Laetiporus sulphureus 93-53]KZT07128.1 hypothetical protein LAESUDRAFT_713923 [Laetiporus sulphureus 93-53]